MAIIQGPKIFVINLESSIKRRESVIKQMKALGLNFEFFRGVDGKILNLNNTKLFDVNYCPEKFGFKLNEGEFGCASAHILLYLKIVEEQYDEVVILEDDFLITPDFKEVIYKIYSSGPKRRELTYLYHGKAKKWPFKRKINSKYNLFRYISPSKNSKRCIISAMAYMLTLKGARKLLNISLPMKLPADYFLGLIQYNKLKTYGVEPVCVKPADFNSEIDKITQRSYGQHIKN